MISPPPIKAPAIAAEHAARATFSKKPALSLDQDTIAYASAMEHRERLTGAFLIEIHRIRPDPMQPRRDLDPSEQGNLQASIEKHGILQPITVQYIQGESVYQVISGERRYQAAKGLGLRAIPCWIRTPKAEEVLCHQLVENWQRLDLKPFELADALAVLRDSKGYSQKDLATLLGKPESEISRALAIHERISPDVRTLVEDDRTATFGKRHLIALAHVEDTAKQLQTAKTVREKKLTAEETERFVREAQAKSAGIKTRGAPLTQRLRYLTSKAAVTLTFRRRNVTSDEILAALDEVRDQVRKHAADSQPAS